MPAPIILFAYNRPMHTERLLKSLVANQLVSGSELHVFCDGPKTEAEAKNTEAVRALARNFKAAKKIHLHASSVNSGLARSVISGLDLIFSEHESAIILEDDLILSPVFLEFMNRHLDHYRNVPEVMSVSGYMYPIQDLPPAFFLSLGSSWGWGTWKRAWSRFVADEEVLIKKIEDAGLTARFNFSNSNDFMQMLKLQQKKEIDSWAIRWYASIFTSKGLTLFPGRSLVNNTGHDGTGTHSYRTKKYDAQRLPETTDLFFPAELTESEPVKRKLEAYFRQPDQVPLVEKIKYKLKKITRQDKKS